MVDFSNYVVRYYSVSYTRLKETSNCVSNEGLQELAMRETADFFQMTAEQIQNELDIVV